MSLFGPIDLNHAIATIVILLIAIDVHELAHAVIADRLGDPTARRMGELSLNPVVHMDQVGLMLLVLTSLGGWAFTYGRTHVTPTNLRYGPQRGGAIVAIVGPLANLLLAVIIGLVLRLAVGGQITLSASVFEFLTLALSLNLLLFVLNLLPIPPLDGFTVLGGFLTARQMYTLAPLQQYGPLIILLLFITDGQTHIVSNLLGPSINQLAQIIVT